MVNKNYCMASYLVYRYVFNEKYSFSRETRCSIVDLGFNRIPVKNSEELYKSLESSIRNALNKGKIALALSGGIDSAILARLVPPGTKAYTFRCVVPGVDVVDETEQAKTWAQYNKLDHEIIDIYWEDIEAVVDELMLHKGTPIHSIEAQICIAAKKARENQESYLIFGENADIIYGGMDGLLKKDWYYGEFIDRYMYVNPTHVLKNVEMDLTPFQKYEKNGHIDGYDFTNEFFRQEALGTYINACQTAGVTFVGPYSETYLDGKIDYERIRKGDTKYLVRELFLNLYPKEKIPDKIPMPRPMDEWLADWEGPTREEFIPHCSDMLNGDQKWMLWSLERFLNLLEGEKEI